VEVDIPLFTRPSIVGLLQGEHIEWLGCALYVAGQSSTLETVEGGTSSGNKVSLTQILRATKLK